MADSKSTETVKVMVRCRPLSSKEKNENRKVIVEVDEKLGQIIVKKPNDSQVKSFSFDSTFGMDSLQQSLYEQSGFQLVENVLEGYNGTIFAYGQTGCGKTFIMMGVQEDEQLRGIIPRTFNQIVTMVDTDDSKKFLVRCSFLQIYNEEIHDLLSESKSNLELKESPDRGVFIKDLSLNAIKTANDMERLMNIGYKNRAVRATQMNAQSSRSHSIFTIYIESEETGPNGDSVIKAGKLNLVDLAGSERQSKTHATGDGLKQAAKINLSLSALGNVISALVDGKTNHIPYRDSKLTRLLQDSLGGNTKTIMIAALSPADYNYEQTISTLRYASRAKFIKNKPRINEDPKDAALREYAQEIKRLKLMLEGKIPISSFQSDPCEPTSNSNSHGIRDALRQQDKMLKNQHQERQKVQLQLQSLQEIMTKPKARPEQKEEKKKLMNLKQELRQRKKKREDYRRDKEEHGSIIVNKQKNFQNLNEEIDSMRSEFKQLRHKYASVQEEISDVKMEQESEKQDLLETIRQQEKDITRLTSIMEMLFNGEQIQDIERRCFKDQETQEYEVPRFFFKQKDVSLPKLRDLQEAERIGTLTSQSSFRIIESPKIQPRSNSISKNIQLNPIPVHLKSDTNFMGLQSRPSLKRPSKLDPLLPLDKPRKP